MNIQQWVDQHRLAQKRALQEIRRLPVASFLTACVIAIGMSLPTALYLFIHNVKLLSTAWQGNPTVSVYLKPETAPAQIEQFEKALRTNPTIQAIKYTSKEEGLASFEKIAELRTVMQSLKTNPLPAVIDITPIPEAQTPLATQQLTQQLQQYPWVDRIQSDTLWLKRLYYLINAGERIALSLGFLFAVAVVLIIGNTLRLTIQQYRHPIQVSRLVGATPGFILRPFLYQGLAYGAIGGTLGVLIVQSLWVWIVIPIEHLLLTYQATTAIQGLNFNASALILMLSMFLGFIGALFPSLQLLKEPEIL